MYLPPGWMYGDSRWLIQVSADHDFTEIMASWVTSSYGNGLCGRICLVHSSREPVYSYSSNLTHRVTLVDDLYSFLVPRYQGVILFLSVNAVVDSVGPVEVLWGLVIPYSEPRLVHGGLAAQEEMVRLICGVYPGGGIHDCTKSRPATRCLHPREPRSRGPYK